MERGGLVADISASHGSYPCFSTLIIDGHVCAAMFTKKTRVQSIVAHLLCLSTLRAHDVRLEPHRDATGEFTQTQPEPRWRPRREPCSCALSPWPQHAFACCALLAFVSPPWLPRRSSLGPRGGQGYLGSRNLPNPDHPFVGAVPRQTHATMCGSLFAEVI